MQRFVRAFPKSLSDKHNRAGKCISLTDGICRRQLLRNTQYPQFFTSTTINQSVSTNKDNRDIISDGQSVPIDFVNKQVDGEEQYVIDPRNDILEAALRHVSTKGYVIMI